MELTHFWFVLFFAVTAIQLISLFFKRGIVHAISKSLLMPLLLVIYIFCAKNIYWPVISALIFGFAGDVFLLNIKNPVRFKLGLASFLLGHLAYIIVFINFAQPFNINALAVSFAAAIVFSVIIYKIVRPSVEMKIPVIIYETVITAMAVFAFQVFINLGFPAGLFVFAGSLLFLLSDSILARFTFVNQPKYGQFFVMLTYIAAQFFIILGFIRL